MVEKSDGDRRKALRDLVATVEAHIALCTRNGRNESNKFDFLRNAPLAESRASQILYSIGEGTYFL